MPRTFAAPALAVLAALASSAVAAPRHRPVCVEVHDPGVGPYRICPPRPRRSS